MSVYALLQVALNIAVTLAWWRAMLSAYRAWLVRS
jgi:hypothetical protein